MHPLPSPQFCTRSLLSRCPSRFAPSTRCIAARQQKRHKADIVERTSGQIDSTPKFESPFKNDDTNPTTKIPSFGHYMSKRGETSNKTFQYFMVGGMGLLTAAGAKATVQGESTLRVIVCCQMTSARLELSRVEQLSVSSVDRCAWDDAFRRQNPID